MVLNCHTEMKETNNGCIGDCLEHNEIFFHTGVYSSYDTPLFMEWTKHTIHKLLFYIVPMKTDYCRMMLHVPSLQASVSCSLNHFYEQGLKNSIDHIISVFSFSMETM